MGREYFGVFQWGQSSVVLLTVVLIALFHGEHLSSTYYGSVELNFPDEVIIGRNAVLLRDGQLEDMNLPGYPPGIFFLHDLVTHGLRILEPNEDPTIMARIHSVRLVSLLLSILTGVCIVFIVHAVVDDRIAALLAGVIWAANPEVIPRIVVALTESAQAFFITLACLFAVLSLKHSKNRYAMLSIVAGLLAVVFKYTAFPALLFGVLVPFWMCFKKRRTSPSIKLLAGQIGLIALAFVWLVFIYGATALSENPEPSRFLSGNFGASFTLGTISRNFATAGAMINLSLPVLAFLLGASGIVYAYSFRLSWHLVIGLTAIVVIVFHLLFINAYLVFPAGLGRYVVPIIPLLIVVLVTTIKLFVDRLSTLSRWRVSSLARSAILVGLGVLWLGQPLQASIIRLQDVRVEALREMVTWTEANLQPGQTLFLTPSNRNLWILFDHRTGDYSGPLRPYIYLTELTDRTLPEWRDLYVDYAVLYHHDFEQLPADYRQEMLPLRSFEDNSIALGVYAVFRPDVELLEPPDTGITLMGYDLEVNSTVIRFRPFWRSRTQMETAYQAYVHLVARDSGSLVAQADGLPASVNRPTNTWDIPSEIIPGSVFEIAIPEGQEATEYNLVLGLYDLETSQRLQTTSGDDFLLSIPIPHPK